MINTSGGAFNIDEFLSSLNSFSDANAQTKKVTSKVDDVTDDGFFSANNIGKSLTGLAQLLGAFSGMKQMDLAEDQFSFQKDAFRTNLTNQANLTNSQLADRQDMRNRDAAQSGRAGEFETTANYLNRFGASSTVGG